MVNKYVSLRQPKKVLMKLDICDLLMFSWSLLLLLLHLNHLWKNFL